MKRFSLIALAASLLFVTPAAAQETPRPGGVLKVDYLMREVPRTPEEIARLRAKVEDDTEPVKL